MTVILHISDPHFGTERPSVVQALQQLAKDQRPAVTILSGDITQRARNVEFDAARALMRHMPSESCLVLPGNHDIPLFALLTRLFSPYSRYQRVFGNDLEPTLETPDLLAIGVRTTRRYRHIEGEVSAKQIRRVALRLKQARSDQLRIVVTHQPVFVTRPEDEEHLLRGCEQAIDSWAEAGADLILGGHIHRPFVRALHESVSGLSRPLWIVQAGTAVSTRIRHDANNSINLIRYGLPGEVRRCVVERWDYHEESQAFQLVEEHQLQLSNG